MLQVREPETIPPPEKTGLRTTSTVILATAASAAGLFFGRDFFVPIVFALLLNALFRPIVRWLERRRLPTTIGAAIVLLGIITLMTAAGFALAGPLQRWLQDAPQRFNTAGQKLDKLRQPVQQVKEVATQLEHAAQGPTTAPAPALSPGPPPPNTSLANRFVGGTTKFISELVEVLLLLYLLLAAGDMFVKKLIKIIPLWRDKQAAEQVVDQSQGVVMRYLLVTLAINVGQGTVVALVLWWLKMPSPLLWGLFTVILEFIPYLGATVIIAMLAVIAFATFDDIGHIFAVPGSYLIITTIQNNVVSPIAYGQHLKLNPVAVLIGVILWWFLWGIPGAFLAVPIIATIKIISDHVEILKPVGEFLGE